MTENTTTATSTTTTFGVDGKSLTTNLAFVKRTIGVTNRHPVSTANGELRALRVSVADGVASLTMFDYETAVTVRMTATGSADVAEFLVDYVAFADGVRAVGTKATLEVSAGDAVLTLTGDGMTVTVPRIAADVEAPTLPVVDAGGPLVVMAGADAARAGAALAVSVGTDSTLPMLTGIRLEGDPADGVTAASTDRFKLAVCDTDAANVAEPFGALLPSRAFLALCKRSAKDSAVSVRLSPASVATGKHALAEYVSDSVTIVARTLDAEFPRFRQLMPSDDDIRATFVVDGAVLSKRVAALKASAYSVTIAVDTDGSVRLIGRKRGDGAELVSSVTLVEASTLSAPSDGVAWSAFAADYVAAICAAAPRGEKITVRLGQPNRPTTIGWTNTLTLIMPTRLPESARL